MRRYTDQEIERGLVALAVYSGNVRRATQELAKEGLTIPRETLRDWQKNKAQAYARVREQIMPSIRANLAEQHTAMAYRAIETADKTYNLLHAQLDSGEVDVKDLAKVAQVAHIGSGIHTQRGSELRGEATTIVEHRPAPETVRNLASRFPAMFIDSTATEVDTEKPALDAGQSA